MSRSRLRTPADLWAVRLFLAALAALLVGYMFMGRGFAHLGVPPLYVGEIVLVLGLVSAAVVLVRARPPLELGLVHWALLAFMVWGLVRTVPYLAIYGLDALRDAVLWGYALFAVFAYLLVDRTVLRRGMEWYAWVLPVFAVWLPISWMAFGILSADIDPARPGEVVPLVFFKSGDMAVHIAGAIGYLALGPGIGPLARHFHWRMLVVVPLGWTALVGFATNRGSLVAVTLAASVALLIGWRWRTWAPILAGGVLALAVFALPALVPSVSEGPTGSARAPTGTLSPSDGESPSSGPSPPASPAGRDPIEPPGRQVALGQIIENVFSIFGSSTDPGLSGTRAFRLEWWGDIVDYTVFGEYFWTGKGFGVNLATADGFQPTADESLRAPHNSHITVLARMGVPGLVGWAVLNGAWAVGLLRALLRHRRRGDALLAGAAGWIGVYWVAMMVNTSFDPYLEGPQGGIWFWTLFGVGLVVMRLGRERSAA